MRISLAAIAIVLALVAAASAQITPSISVSGRLTNATTGVSLAGSFPANFTLFSAATGGSLLYSTVQTLSVTNGLFATTISPNLPFNADYWLELRVAGELLNPRQKLTPAPYALYANQAGGLGNGIVSLSGNNVGIGTSSPASQLTINADANLSTRGIRLTQNGSAITSLWATSAGGSSGIGTDSADAFNIFTGGFAFPSNSRIHVTPAGNVGIGTTAPDTRLEVLGTAKLGVRANLGEDVYTDFIPPSAGDTDTCNGNNNVIYTCGVDEVRTCTDINGTAANQKRTVTCAIGTAGISVAPSGNVGVNTATPSVALEVKGNIKASNVGTIYTRWGRDDCPNNTKLVYEGYIANDFYQHGGSGANMLCLTKDPTWGNFSPVNENGALLHATEYETSTSYGLSQFNSINDREAPCAVCLVENATITLMHPGSLDCPAGWNKQYSGYLMAQHYTHRNSEYICVDLNAEAAVNATATNNNGNLLYPTEAEATLSAISGGKYVTDREVTCSVCTY